MRTDGDRRCAVVTGAARRVGRAVSLELARCGLDLLLAYRSSAEEIEATRRDAEGVASAAGRPVRVQTVRADLGNAADVDRLGATLAALPAVDVLVHNASSYGPSPLGSISRDEAMSHFAVNALAPLLLTQAARPALERSSLRGGASVVCFGDIHVMGRPRRGYAAYSMSKGALATMVECLARDLAPQVRVNAVAPGVVAWPEGTPEAERRAYEARIPLGRSGTPEEAADAVRWLALEATYVTGETIRLDGGRWLA